MQQHTETTIPELPSLDSGIHLLDTDSDTTGAIHSLVLDHLLTTDDEVYWIDTHGHATTHVLAQLAPSRRTLDRVHVARGFTAYQHYALIEDVGDALSPETSLLVVPALDGHYRSDDLTPTQREDMLVKGLAKLAGLARRKNLTVLLTRTTRDEFTDPIASVADRQLTCEQTKFGPRFTGPDFETLVYPVDHGFVQTTLAFWQQVLADREPLHQHTPTASTA